MGVLRLLGKKLYPNRVACVAGGFVLLADQLTKDMARTLWDVGGPASGALALRLSKNPGMALGIFSGLPDGLRVPLLLALSLLSAIGIALVSRPFAGDGRLRGWGLAFIYAGAAGNGMDRLWHGYVVDFIEIYAGELAFPAFNLADLAVASGALLVAFVVAFGAARRRSGGRPGGGETMDLERQEEAVLEAPLGAEGEEQRPGALMKMMPGTTLVEILIVVAIIGLVLGAVAIGVIPLFAKGQKGLAWNGTKTVEQMYTAWRAVHPDSECPDSVEDLQKTAGKKGQTMTDPWGTPYEIRCPSEHDLDIDVVSAGPDKRVGSDDDIGNWMPQPKE